MSYSNRQEITETMQMVRDRTFEIYRWVIDEADLRRSPGFGYRPMLWHLAHIGVFESYWILERALKQPSINPRYDVIFDPIRTPREEATELPTMIEMQTYLEQVRTATIAAL